MSTLHCALENGVDLYVNERQKKTMVVFKMRDSVPSARYSSICIVLHVWSILLIPTYRVYRLYDSLRSLKAYKAGS